MLDMKKLDQFNLTKEQREMLEELLVSANAVLENADRMDRWMCRLERALDKFDSNS